MERQLFDWEDWDSFGEQIWYFATITLRSPVGPHPIGARFSGAVLNLEEGKITLQQGDNCESEETYTLTFVVGARV